MMVVLSGPWGVGKSKVIQHLRDYYGFAAPLPWSTSIAESKRGTKYNRLVPQGSSNGSEYDIEALKDKVRYSQNFCGYGDVSCGESAMSGFWCQPYRLLADTDSTYGVTSSHYLYQVVGYKRDELAYLSNRPAVVIEADTAIAKQLYEANVSQDLGRIIFLFLQYDSKDTFSKKLNEKSVSKDNAQEYKAAKESHYSQQMAFFEDDQKKVAGKIFDAHFCSNNELELAEQIIDWLILDRRADGNVPLVNQTPNMRHTMPGILRKEDIQLSMKVGNLRCCVGCDDLSSDRDYLVRCLQSVKEYLVDYDYDSKGRLTPDSIKASAIDVHLSPVYHRFEQNNCGTLDLLFGFKETFDASLSKDISVDDIKQKIQSNRAETYKKLFIERRLDATGREGLTLESGEIVRCRSLEKIETEDTIGHERI